VSGPGIRTVGLVKRFGSRPVLDGVDVVVPAGTVTALLGPNGAGKTTFVRVLSTLVSPDGGHAEIAGCDVVRDPLGARRALGLVVGDERSLYWRLDAAENLRFYAALAGVPRATEGDRIATVLEDVGLDARDRTRVGRYSAGMRGRLCLARALLGEPRVLLLDEATRSIDPVGSRSIGGMIRRLAAERDVAVLMATHDLHEAASIADQVVVLDAGRVIAALRGASADDLDAVLPR
jgi:ABC-type multidrug transport system ATPase subunit